MIVIIKPNNKECKMGDMKVNKVDQTKGNVFAEKSKDAQAQAMKKEREAIDEALRQAITGQKPKYTEV